MIKIHDLDGHPHGRRHDFARAEGYKGQQGEQSKVQKNG
jgi:hypothetical protein